MNQIIEQPATDMTDPTATHTANMLMSPRVMESLNNFAMMMAKGSATVPAHLKGNPADCMAITMQAAQWGMNPFAVAQKTHTVNGVLGYEAQLVNAVVTAMAPTTGRLNYEWFGPWENVLGKFRSGRNDKGKVYHQPNWSGEDEKGCGVRVYATFKGETEPRTLELLLVQAQVRNSTLWASDPKQQLAYLATKRWSRLHCPDVILGVYTPDELEERAAPVERDVTPAKEKPVSKTAGLRSRLQAATAAPEPAPAQEPVQPEPEVIDGGSHAETVARWIEAINSCADADTLDDCAQQIAADQIKAAGNQVPPAQMAPVTAAYRVQKARFPELAEQNQ